MINSGFFVAVIEIICHLQILTQKSSLQEQETAGVLLNFLSGLLCDGFNVLAFIFYTQIPRSKQIGKAMKTIFSLTPELKSRLRGPISVNIGCSNSKISISQKYQGLFLSYTLQMSVIGTTSSEFLLANTTYHWHSVFIGQSLSFKSTLLR